MSCVPNALPCLIPDDLALIFGFCVCFLFWTLFLSEPTTYCCASWTPTSLPNWILQQLLLLAKDLIMDDAQPGTSSSSGQSQKKRKRSNSLPNELTSSPMKKRPKTTKLNSYSKMVIINLFKYFVSSMATYPYKQEIYKNIANIMSISEKTVTRTINEYKRKGAVSSPERPHFRTSKFTQLDDFTLTAIRMKVHQFYYANELPTIDKVLTAVNEDDDLPTFSRSSMYKLMKKMNFKYTKRSRKSVLLERPDLIAWRRTYLMRIKDLRKENRKIYYTDETWVNEGHTTNYIWVDGDIESSRQAFLRGLSTGLQNPQKGRRLIVTHIGSEDGFLEGGENIFQAKKTDSEGDYHGEMDAETFEKWFKGILEKIEPGSVIVLDNAPYHSRRLERIPNMSWRKADIQGWLTEKNIQFEEKEIKAQLLAKFDKEKYQKKYIDELAASKQILVLRLPPYHCELNPIELIWAQIKGYVGRHNKTFKLDDVEELLKDGISRIGTESWKKCVEHIKKKEDEMMRLDGIIDDLTDKPTPEFVIHVGESSSSEDFDSSGSE